MHRIEQLYVYVQVLSKLFSTTNINISANYKLKWDTYVTKTPP